MAEYVVSEYVLEEPSSVLDYWRTHERIVRCRDCKFYTPESMTREEREFGVYENVWEPGGCFNPSRCSSTWDHIKEQMVPVGIDTDPDGFCKWGERRDDG